MSGPGDLYGLMIFKAHDIRYTLQEISANSQNYKLHQLDIILWLDSYKKEHIYKLENWILFNNLFISHSNLLDFLHFMNSHNYHVIPYSIVEI